MRDQAERLAGGQSGRESQPDSHRPDPEPSSFMTGRMISRLAFLAIATFWVVMNVLLWRAEYSERGSGISVPVDLVWRKILTAPDASSLTVYQGTEKTGFCEFSTSIEQAMAGLDEGRPPPEALA